MGKVDIPYVEKDGILYPLLTIHADMELSNPGYTMEMWKLREQAKMVAEETVLMDIVYQYH